MFFKWIGSKESTCLAGDVSLIPGSGGFLEERSGIPLQYSCLGNPWILAGYIVHGVAKESDMNNVWIKFHICLEVD